MRTGRLFKSSLAIAAAAALSATALVMPGAPESAAAAEAAATSGVTLALPFGVGQAWSANGPHANAGEGPRNSIDLAGGDGKVLAAGGGRVELVKCTGGTMLMVDHGNGWHTSYYHIVKIRVIEGQRVETGAYLGDIGMATPCGGRAHRTTCALVAVELHRHLRLEQAGAIGRVVGRHEHRRLAHPPGRVEIPRHVDPCV